MNTLLVPYTTYFIITIQLQDLVKFLIEAISLVCMGNHMPR
jgi:hypothetical protein